MTTRDPLKIALDGYVFDAQVTDHWAQVSIKPTSGPTHYMRLPHAEAARLGQYLVAALPPPEPADTNRAENILREFEELHGQITIDERKWLRDRIATELTPPEPTEGLRNVLQKLMDCGRAIVGADPNDERSAEAFDMFWKAQGDARAALRAMPLQDHGGEVIRHHEDVLSDARSAVRKWADWCHQNEAQWSGWGDMVIPQGATAWTESAEKVLASFPAMVAEEGTKS